MGIGSASARRATNASRRMTGFTLIELMIVVAIVGILAAVAYPSYQQYIIRSNRAAAQAQMMEIANREQQYFLANRSYADLATLGFSLPSEVSGRYSCAVTVGTGNPPSYTITCTPITGSAQAADGAISLTSAGVKSPADKW